MFFSVSCIHHSVNFVAHSLARYACQIDDDVVWLEESPLSTLEALYLVCVWIPLKLRCVSKLRFRSFFFWFSRVLE